ncbi:MAG TPA: A/G-specific adenine glycosylase [Nocardioides sp.]
MRPPPEVPVVDDVAGLHTIVLDWFDENARELPWRGESASPWSVMVSEFMLQQTPVVRVLPVHAAWMEAWPTPAALAAASTGDAVRAWGRLGYPRRALRLHAAATAIVAEHAGTVPASYDALLALPGVGDYTAAAIASFAYGQRHVVLDTNVRRVIARVAAGSELPARSVNRAERDLAASLLPDPPADAATWNVGLMELGALVCSVASPGCDRCPLVDRCAWVRAGRPAYDGPARVAQTYAGTDRQCRGRLLAVVRDADGPVALSTLEAAWAIDVQRNRCLAGLVADGLVARVGPASYALP